jgi:hypothetical protein
MGMYLEKEKVVSRCQKSPSQNQQNLSVKNPKHQAGIEAAQSHAQTRSQLKMSRYNHVPTKSGHQDTQKPPKVLM